MMHMASYNCKLYPPHSNVVQFKFHFSLCKYSMLGSFHNQAPSYKTYKQICRRGEN